MKKMMNFNKMRGRKKNNKELIKKYKMKKERRLLKRVQQQ